jgi:hypothetical protein
MSGPLNAFSDWRERRFYTVREVDVPSVTTILGLGWPKEWMGPWAAKEVALEAERGVEEYGPLAIEAWVTMDRELHNSTKTHTKYHQKKCPYVASALGYLKGTPFRKRDKAGDTGTSIHDVLEAIAHEQVIPEDAPFREYLEAWRDAYRPRILESEPQVANLTDGYAGSLDLIADIYGKRLLIDLKTSKRYDGKGKPINVHREWSLQLAAYRYAEFMFADSKEYDMPEVEGGAILWLPQDAPDEWMFIEVPAGAKEYARFLSAKAIHDDYTAHEGTSVGEIILPRALEEVA